MKYLLILLLSVIVLNAKSLDEDQTLDAISSGNPMFYACRLGYNLRPATLQNGRWGRQPLPSLPFSYTYTDPNLDKKSIVYKLKNATFPSASQATSPSLPSLSAIALAAYQGDAQGDVTWDASGPDNTCRTHGYGKLIE